MRIFQSFLGKPLYGGTTRKSWLSRSLWETKLYANEGKLEIRSTIPDGGRPRKNGEPASTEVMTEIGPEKCEAVLDGLEAAFGAVAIERMAAIVARSLKREKEWAGRRKEWAERRARAASETTDSLPLPLAGEVTPVPHLRLVHQSVTE